LAKQRIDIISLKALMVMVMMATPFLITESTCQPTNFHLLVKSLVAVGLCIAAKKKLPSTAIKTS